MLPIEWLRLVVDWCSLPILVLLSLILLRRRFYRELPLFFSYVVVTSLSTFVRLIVYAVSRPPAFLHAHPFFYTYTYWISSLVMSAFAIMAVYEIFIKRLFAGFYRVRFYRYLFPTMAVAIVLFAILIAILSPQQPWMPIGVADRVVVFIRLISLGFFTFLMIVMGRAWTRHELAIVFSFGILAATNFFTSVMWGKNHKIDQDSLVSYLPTIAWDIACVIWLIAFGKSAKPLPDVAPKPIDPGILQEAKKWEGTLRGWLAPPKKK
jgi:hypothetical protein